MSVEVADSEPLSQVEVILRPDEEKKSKKQARSIYHDKLREFAATAQTTLPIFGIDLPSPVVSQLAIAPENWITDDATWRSLSSGLGHDRQLGDALRQALQSCKASGKAPFAYLYPLRDGKVSLINLCKT